MSSNDEIRLYLDYLLDHSSECSGEGCLVCATLQSVCEFLRSQIFSVVVYPEAPISTRSMCRAA